MPISHTELYCVISLLLDHEQYEEYITNWTLFLMFIYWVQSPRFRIVGQNYVAFLIMKTQTQYQSSEIMSTSINLLFLLHSFPKSM